MLQRTTRQLHLTDAGTRFFASCKEIIAALEAAEDDVNAAGTNLSGSLRIAAPLSFGVTHLGPVVHEFSQLHPDVHFDIDFSDERADLVREGFDLAVRIGTLDDSTLAGKRFATIRHAVCASPAYLATAGTPTTPAELAQHVGLHYTGAGSDSWPYKAVDGRQGAVRLQSRLRANSGEFLRDAAIAGCGVIMQPLFIVHTAISSRALTPLLTEWEWATMDAWLLYPKTRHVPARVRAFIDFVAARYRGRAVWDECLPGRQLK